MDRLGLPRGLLGKQVPVGTFPHAVILTLRLLNSLNPVSKASLHTTGKAHVARQDLAWALNALQRLWRITYPWLRNPGQDTMDARSQICSQFLECVKRFFNHAASLPSSLSCTWLQVLAEILALDTLSQMPGPQLQSSGLLNNLAEVSKRSKILGKHMGDIILPTLIYIKNRSRTFGAFELDLQVVNPVLTLE